MWRRAGKRGDAVLRGSALRCCCLTSLARLFSSSKLFAFAAFRAFSSSSLASMSLSYLSTQCSSFSSTFCMGTEWRSAWYKECTGERFATGVWPPFRMVVNFAWSAFPPGLNPERIKAQGLVINHWWVADPLLGLPHGSCSNGQGWGEAGLGFWRCVKSREALAVSFVHGQSWCKWQPETILCVWTEGVRVKKQNLTVRKLLPLPDSCCLD